LRAQRSNPEDENELLLDCFVAEFIIGPAEGRTRRLLAMTGITVRYFVMAGLVPAIHVLVVSAL
jgi:hypothetical protein